MPKTNFGEVRGRSGIFPMWISALRQSVHFTGIADLRPILQVSISFVSVPRSYVRLVSILHGASGSGQTGEHDVNVGLSAVDERVDDTQLTDAQKEYFKQIAGSDMEISWEELKDILDMVIKPEGNNQGYSREVCRSLLALMDVDHSGKLSYQEFNVLWTDVGRWNAVFKLYDKDKSGCLSMLELRQALNSAGYRVNYSILCLLARRYGNKKGKISYKDFLLCAIRLKVMIGRRDRIYRVPQAQLTVTYPPLSVEDQEYLSDKP
uniref:EF-hand domain-containing protein n=1 Tax=Timema cristinae TaxID=61476 RepID=A0A7R9CCV8_TIMCR|nr:unnamed protein product [Timema cristinae]